MAEVVVDLLEGVEIQKQHGELRRSLPAQQGEGEAGAVEKQRPVGEESSTRRYAERISFV
jgi:hypothetical protein